jgi:hypothetical protein
MPAWTTGYFIPKRSVILFFIVCFNIEFQPEKNDRQQNETAKVTELKFLGNGCWSLAIGIEY